MRRTRAERVIAFIETYCYVPEGDLMGQKVQLLGFQKKFIYEVYDNPVPTKVAILSMARKNAKTSTIAFLVLAHLVGPEAFPNSRIVSGALSREQAAEVFEVAYKTVLNSPELMNVVRIIPSRKRLVGLPRNVEYSALSADAKTNHGKSPIVAIIDEVGQVRGPTSDFIDSISTAQAAYKNSLIFYISTQAPTDADLFSIMIDTAIKHPRPSVVCHVYCADPNAEIMNEEQWHKANPALGVFRSLPDVREQAEKALYTPGFEPTFRNLVLNQRVDSTATWLSRTVWEANADPVTLPERIEAAYAGLDLSRSRDLTAFVLIWEQEGKWRIKPYFWMPEDTIEARSKEDHQPYAEWANAGLIRLTPGKTVNFAHVIADIVEIIARIASLTIAYDRYKIEDFKSRCEELGVSLPLVEFGQGFRDMTIAIEAVEDVLLNQGAAHGKNEVLTMCVRNAKIVRDDAGGRKISKTRSIGRIDGAVSMAMAFGAHAKKHLTPRKPEYKIFIA